MEARRQETSYSKSVQIPAEPRSPEILSASISKRESHKLDRETGRLILPHLGRVIYMSQGDRNTLYVFHEGLSMDNPQAFMTYCDAEYEPIGGTKHLGSLTDFFEKINFNMNRTLETLSERS